MRFITDAVKWVKAKAGKLALLATVAVAAGNSAKAADGFTMPDMPLDFSVIVTAGLVTIGTIVTAIAGCVIIVRLIKIGIAWVGKAFGGKA